MVLTIGKSRPARTISSATASSAAESERPAEITGFKSSTWSAKVSEAMRHSCACIQFTLPFRVLISPLWARIRNRSEEHTSELQSLMRISYADVSLEKKQRNKHNYK